ncbi:MAG: glycosyltransferase family 1 protein [Proteobacteria bacterium]|nr:glycosyltransferase family 1 protein [Pseudomonadota bacterium]
MNPEGAAQESVHIIVVSVGTIGDVQPFIGLALALTQRGHRISFLAPAVHEGLIRNAGLAFHPLGSREDYHALINNPDIWDSKKAFAALWRGTLGNLRQIPEFIQSLPAEEPCLLLSHPFGLPAAALARAVRQDMPIVGAYVAPANMRTVHNPLVIGPFLVPRWLPTSWRRWVWKRVDARFVDPFACFDLNAERRLKGLRPIARVIEHMHTVADLSLTLFPTWFAKDQPDWPQPRCGADFPLYEPHPNQELPVELEQFLAGGDAPIVFTPGTGHRHARGYFAQALDAVTQLGRRAIFLTPFAAQLPDISANDAVLWQSYVPMRQLLPRAAAIVHHGGIGTTAEALRAGIPQLVVPLAHDQFDNGARIEALGVGRSIKANRASGATLKSALASLTTSQTVNAQCKAAAMRLTGTPDLSAVCDAMEMLLRTKRQAST